MNKIRIKHGENEIELEGTDGFIVEQIDAFYKKIDKPLAARIKEDIISSTPKVSHGGKKPTPAEFYREKKRNDGTSQVLIFGKYLEEFEGKTDFSRDEVNKIAAHAKLSKDIHSQYFTNAVKQGLLRQHGKGRYSLTLSAESALSAME